MRKLRAHHWSFMFGEMAIYSFVILMLTGAFLTFFYDPSMSRVVYDGSYAPLRGISMSAAYASTMDISFEVRGGLLMRQVHHWAASIFVATVVLQLVRMFFTGAFRRPRRLQWVIWVGLLVLGMVGGVTGGILPDDMMSGGSLGLIQSIVLSIPVVGTWIAGVLFAGAFPGEEIISRMYWIHLLPIPLIMGGLLLARTWLVRRHGHSEFAGAVRGPRPGRVAMPLVTTGVLLALGLLAQINPIWLLGPYKPGVISAGSVPDWYMGFLDGALRITPGWEVTVFGYTLTLAILIPALIVPGAFFTILAIYPVAEERLADFRARRDALGRPKTKARVDRDHIRHNILDRPRDHAVRTAIGAAGVTFYGLLWAAAANDQIALQFGLSLEAVTLFFRYAVLIGPFIAFTVTHRLCLGLQRQDRETKEHGLETGIIVRSPGGGFQEVTIPDRPAVPSGR